MASKSNIELYFFIIVEKRDNEKRSYTDTVVMETLECLEKSRVRMINFLNNTFLALHYSFIAITKSLQSLRTLKLFYNSCFGTLGTKIPGILRNYFLTSITGNQIPEVLDQRKSLVCKLLLS